MTYEEFIGSKLIEDKPSGIEVDAASINAMLFPFQRDIVRWALRRGRACIFADCGMGKTPMQLEWAKHVPGRVLILAPLAVAAQTVREGLKFGIEVTHARDNDGAFGKIVITNYEAMHKIDIAAFDGVVLDESSVLKSYMGKTKRAIIDRCETMRWKLACTATPAPNDHMELGNHAEFLGVMKSNEMLSRWFINDSMEAGAYRLKGHGKADFWRWVASWAVSLRKPSDVGNYDDAAFVLPKLSVTVRTVGCAPPDGMLFVTPGMLSATEVHSVKRTSAVDRASVVAEFCGASNDQCLVWCDTNYEADAICDAIADAVEVRGNDSDETKTEQLLSFADGRFKVLCTKPSIAGFGMNFQQCHRIAFVGLSYSFEALYQAMRRVYRFGQKHAVECLIVETEAESGIRGVVERKMQDHETMQTEMCEHMKDFQSMTPKRLKPAPEVTSRKTERWEMFHGDCVEIVAQLPDESVGLSVFSPPFANLYIYSDSMADMGNSANYEEFFVHFGYLIKELFRVTINGRIAAVHCKDLPAYKGRDGAAGLIDFPGAIIKAFEAHGWQYHSRVTIWKDPVTEMQRTKNHGLLHKQLCKDSAASRMGMADYVLAFRKWDGEEFNDPVRGESKEVRFDAYVGEDAPKNVKSARDMSIQVWQRYASPVWHDIRQQRVLQGSKHATTEEDEKHICPLQLDVIERCVALWSNPNDTVLSPFAGIGSEGYVSVSAGRKFIGCELKREYWMQACSNIERADREANVGFLPLDTPPAL